MTDPRSRVRIEPWGGGGLSLLEQLNTPDMTRHVGGPETSDELAARQAKFERPDSRQYRLVAEPGG